MKGVDVQGRRGWGGRALGAARQNEKERKGHTEEVTFPCGFAMSSGREKLWTMVSAPNSDVCAERTLTPSEQSSDTS